MEDINKYINAQPYAGKVSFISSDTPFKFYKVEPIDPTSPQDVLRNLPDDSTARKEIPITSGVVDYFPLALAEIAKVSKFGNDKHNPGKPLRWARGKSTDHADCIARHLIQRGTIGADGIRHSAALAWRALAMLQEELEAEAGWKPQVQT
jgi:hypothetical protein